MPEQDDSAAHQGDILIVDDNPINLDLLSKMLGEQGYRVRVATSGARALAAAAWVCPDLIMLDITMPQMDGYEVCQRLKGDPGTADVPVIFISALDAEVDKMRAFAVGGVDYVMKPFQVGEVLARIENQLRLTRLQRALELSRDQALEGSRSKSAFLANMSHELRTPLNAIIGYSEMLHEEMTDDGNERVASDLEKIRTAGKHLLSLINDILDLSKVEAGKMELQLEEVSVPDLVPEVVNLIRPLVERNGNILEVDCEQNLASVHGDAMRIRQILVNLLSNASKFTTGGRVSLSIRKVIRGNMEWACLSVSDSGIGMTPEQLGRLFQPFSQAEKTTATRFGGTGLGLVISRKFCQLMGGDIDVESAPGQGSTFTARLPLRPKPTEGAATRLLKGQNALLVGGDTSTRDVVERTLVRSGVDLSSATTEAALTAARDGRPAMILLSIPPDSSLEWRLLEQLKTDPSTNGIPVIAISVVDEMNRAYRLGANGYLSQPIDPSSVLGACEKVLRIAALEQA